MNEAPLRRPWFHTHHGGRSRHRSQHRHDAAGEVGGTANITIGGDSFGVGGEIGLKADGFRWAPTTTVELPLITLTGPNPVVSLTSFAIHAAMNLVKDPLGTAGETASDVIDAAKEVAEAVDAVIEIAEHALDHLGGLLGLGDDDRNILTTSDFGNYPKQLAPGAVILD